MCIFDRHKIGANDSECIEMLNAQCLSVVLNYLNMITYYYETTLKNSKAHLVCD